MTEADRASNDPITREVIGYSLRAIASELETNLTRTSFSPLVYEYRDYAVGIVAPDGALICQGAGGLPIFLADIGAPLESVLDAHPARSLIPGDAIVTNDPASTGQHLNNVTVYAPAFDGDELIAFIAVRTHWSDVGGQVFGSATAIDTTDIYQEGLQLPALKICRAGEVDADIKRLIASNCRTPDVVLGDLAAQLAACDLGKSRLGELVARYGWSNIRESTERQWDRSERVARERIENLPNGNYTAECFLDDDGIRTGVRIPFKVTVRIQGDTVTIDMTEISDEVRGPYNSGLLGGGLTAAKVAFKYAILPDVDADEGCFRPLSLVLPLGKILSASPAAAKARWNVPMSSAIDVILRAFSEVMPERSFAGHHAAQNSFQFVGRHASGALWQHHDTAHGGWGASAAIDGGGPYKTLSHGDCKDIPVEIVEARYPLRVEEVRLREDSGGPGRRRGGLGMVRRYTVLADCTLTVTFERTGCPPWGLFGGAEGAVGSVEVVTPSGETLTFSKVDRMPLAPGTTVTMRTAGGGGYGPPEERDRELLLKDVELGYVSEHAARHAYVLSTARSE